MTNDTPGITAASHDMLSPLAFPNDRVLDLEGRLLWEGRAPKDMKNADTELVLCRYPGSRFRQDKLMNVSALKQMRTHWADVMAGFRHLRSLYPVPAAQMSYIDLWRVCNLAETHVNYLIYRARDPVPETALAPHAAAIFKIIIGLTTGLENLILTDLDQFAARIDHDHLYGFFEENNLFLGRSEVCAGPEHLIREVLEVLTEDPSVTPPDSFNKTRALIGDSEKFLQFANSQMNGKALDYLLMMAIESLYAKVRGTLLAERSIRARLSQAIHRSDRFLPDPTHPLDLLAQLDGSTARDVIHRIIDATVHEPEHGGALKRGAQRLSVLFDEREQAAHPLVVELLGSKGRSSALLDVVSRYLELERIGCALANSLKEQCLASLGVADAGLLRAAIRDFSPSNARMRSLLQTAFGIQITATRDSNRNGIGVVELEFQGEKFFA